MKKTFLLAGLLATMSALAMVFAINWQPKDDSYAIKFDTKGAHGTFKGLKGTMKFDPANPHQAVFDVTVDVNTINTGIGLKNHHAKTKNFFDAEKYPVIRFSSSNVEKTSTGFISRGKLTIKATTKEISIPFVFEKTGEEGIFKGKFSINRTEYDLIKSGVGEEVAIELVIPVKK